MLDFLHFLLNSTSFCFRRNPFWLLQNIVFLTLLGILIAAGSRAIASGSLLFLVAATACVFFTVFIALYLILGLVGLMFKVSQPAHQKLGIAVSLLLLACVALQGFYSSYGQRWMIYITEAGDITLDAEGGELLLVDVLAERERARIVTAYFQDRGTEVTVGDLALFEDENALVMREIRARDIVDEKLANLKGIPTWVIFPSISNRTFRNAG